MNPKFRTLFSGFAEAAQTSTGSALRAMLDGMEETLMDFAEKAESLRGRQGFYDAIGTLSKGRSRIEQGFDRLVKKGFDDFVGEDGAPTPEERGEEMSLVDKDSFEDALAVQVIVSRVSRQCHAELYALKRRLAVINRGVKLRDEDLPGGPYHLARSFSESLSGLPIEKRIKLVLHTLFHKRLMTDVEALYKDFNARLIEAGVLPYLRPTAEQIERAAAPSGGSASKSPDAETRQPSPAGTRREAPVPRPGPDKAVAGTPTSEGISETVLRDVLDLMGRRSGGDSSARSSEYLTPSGAPALPATELANAIGEAAQRPAAGSPVDGLRDTGLVQTEVGPALMAQVGEALLRQRQLVMDLAGRDKVRAIDSDTIDLVGMLFEYMLGVDELPNLVKALLSHLHTPYLKLAILDQSFLDRRDHPARALLDAMIEAGSTLVVETDLRRGIFPELRSTVNRILADFKGDVSLFSELLAAFTKRVATLREKTKISERRSRQAEQGRQQLRAAQQEAAAELKRLIADQALPQVVVEFLNGFLAERLTLILLRGSAAKGSNDWRKSTELARTLIGVTGKVGLASWRANRAKLAGLRKVIRGEPKLLGSYYSRQVELLLSWLEEVEHQGATAKSLQQLVAPEPEESADKGKGVSPPLSPREQAVVERLQKVKFGTLFELRPDGEDNKQRLRLSWYNPTTSRYLFVNQDGGTAAVKDLASLAAELASGDARILTLPGQAFVERALLAIRDRLGRSPSKTTEPRAAQMEQ